MPHRFVGQQGNDRDTLRVVAHTLDLLELVPGPAAQER